MPFQSLISSIAERAKGVDHIVVAMSGGVDSCLVAAAAHKATRGNVFGVTVQSELTASRDFTRAVEVAEQIGIEHHPLCIRALEDKSIRKNAEDRCYHCKRLIFEMMIVEYGDDCLIMDGTNADDDPMRPGLRAVHQFKVFSPLKKIGWGKAQIREVARSIGLPNWNAPSESCLATRVHSGIPLNKERLDMVQAMETFFHNAGVETLRARHDNLVATVEYLPQYAEIMIKKRDLFAALIKRIGLRSFEFKEWTE